MLAIKVRTIHDRNGNPRRGWAVFDEWGKLKDFVNEWYEGSQSLMVKYPGANRSVEVFEVRPSEFNRWLKRGQVVQGT